MIVDTKSPIIAETLKKARLEKGIKVAQLARETGVSKRSIFSIESGESVREETVNKLFDYLGYKVDVTFKVKISKAKKSKT